MWLRLSWFVAHCAFKAAGFTSQQEHQEAFFYDAVAVDGRSQGGGQLLQDIRLCGQMLNVAYVLQGYLGGAYNA